MSNQNVLGRIRNRRRKQEKTIITVIICIAFVAAIVFAFSLLTRQRINADELEGLWIYDSVTSYEFTSHKEGVMHVGEQNYSFSYVLRGRKLNINFESESVRDCVYKISIEGNALTMEGKEGTTGGTYELAKKNL